MVECDTAINTFLAMEFGLKLTISLIFGGNLAGNHLRICDECSSRIYNK